MIMFIFTNIVNNIGHVIMFIFTNIVNNVGHMIMFIFTNMILSLVSTACLKLAISESFVWRACSCALRRACNLA